MRIKRVFIANRGEIAVRIIRACRDLNLETVLAVSEIDKETLGAKLAGRVICIGPSRSAESYLNAAAIITAAKATHSDAIHPGYGFLAEDADFARLCREQDLIFIGPTTKNIQEMGNKLESRALAKKFGVPLAAGSVEINSFTDAIRVCEKVGYPVLIKAAAGGGGRGIRLVREKNELRQAYENASAEAAAAFGNSALYIERYIENARHIEVQILADSFGNVVHLGERDCSMQRRYQKMIEEAPAFGISERLRQRVVEAAVTLAKNIGYENAGTVEFIVDADQEEFYFLEMNTRIQVEHPVTEQITGQDILTAQLLIAGGEELNYSQKGIAFSGFAVECRINAESPSQGFRPMPGKIRRLVLPQGPGIRFDSHCFEGYNVPPFYDSMLGKLIIHAADRNTAIRRMQRALKELVIEGQETNVPFIKFVFAHPDYQKGVITTQWLEKASAEFLTQEGGNGNETDSVY